MNHQITISVTVTAKDAESYDGAIHGLLVMLQQRRAETFGEPGETTIRGSLCDQVPGDVASYDGTVTVVEAAS